MKSNGSRHGSRHASRAARAAVPLAAGATAALLLALAPPALAQEQSQKQAESTEAGGEVATIIVSARKRAESIAEVPTSITAFTTETIKDYNVQPFSDYATKTPDLSFT